MDYLIQDRHKVKFTPNGVFIKKGITGQGMMGQQPQQGGLFNGGQANPALGQNPQAGATGGLFGGGQAQQQGQAGLFGGAQQQPAQGGGLFGGGNPQQQQGGQAGLFGAQQPKTDMNGQGIFGGGNGMMQQNPLGGNPQQLQGGQGAGGGLFGGGQQQQGTQAGGGLFGGAQGGVQGGSTLLGGTQGGIQGGGQFGGGLFGGSQQQAGSLGSQTLNAPFGQDNKGGMFNQPNAQQGNNMMQQNNANANGTCKAPYKRSQRPPDNSSKQSGPWYVNSYNHMQGFQDKSLLQMRLEDYIGFNSNSLPQNCAPMIKGYSDFTNKTTQVNQAANMAMVNTTAPGMQGTFNNQIGGGLSGRAPMQGGINPQQGQGLFGGGTTQIGQQAMPTLGQNPMQPQGLLGANPQQGAQAGGGLFGGSQQPQGGQTGGGLFGGGQQQQGAQTGGGLFGGGQQQQGAQAGGGMFQQGGTGLGATTGQGGLFGQTGQPGQQTGQS